MRNNERLEQTWWTLLSPFFLRISKNEELLNSFLNKKIEILGLKDDIRGYPRIVVNSIEDISIVEDQEDSKKEDSVWVNFVISVESL